MTMMRGWKKDGVLLVVLLVLSGLLAVLDRADRLGRIRAGAEKPFVAGEKRLWSAKVALGDLFSFVSSRQRADQELLRVQGQLCQLAFDQSRLATCEEENRQMRRLLGAPLPAGWQFVPARVLGTGQGLRIGAGAGDGVKTGMMVVSQNVLVGRVKEAGEISAAVERPEDPGVKIPVVVKRPAGGEGEALQATGGVIGQGLLFAQDGVFAVEQILQEEDVRTGDLVLTSGEAGWLPDLVFGVVEEVAGREAELYKSAQVKKLAGDDLQVVFVVKKE